MLSNVNDYDFQINKIRPRSLYFDYRYMQNCYPRSDFEQVFELVSLFCIIHDKLMKLWNVDQDIHHTPNYHQYQNAFVVATLARILNFFLLQFVSINYAIIYPSPLQLAFIDSPTISFDSYS